MKLNKLILTLATAALLPTFACADTDAIATSFERDMYREPVNSSIAFAGETDTLTIEFYAALRDVLDRPAVHATAVISRKSGS